MAEFTLASKQQTNEEFPERVATILKQIQDGDTLYIDDIVNDGPLVGELLRTMKININVSLSACKPNIPSTLDYFNS